MVVITYSRNGNGLRAHDVSVGQVYETSGGERVEVVQDGMDDSDLLLVRYPERIQADGDGNDAAATALMSRSGFADMATFDGFTQLDESVEAGEEDDESKRFGEFTEKAPPNCPVCGCFMDCRDEDGGLPSAVCTRRDGCHGFLDDRDLIDGGYFETY